MWAHCSWKPNNEVKIQRQNCSISHPTPLESLTFIKLTDTDKKEYTLTTKGNQSDVNVDVSTCQSVYVAPLWLLVGNFWLPPTLLLWFSEQLSVSTGPVRTISILSWWHKAERRSLRRVFSETLSSAPSLSSSHLQKLYGEDYLQP